MNPSGIITLLTDFGLSDPYAGIMKGVILSINPRARLVDLTHEIPPGDIAQGAWRLYEAIPFFPKGTVHLAVVDPGVGGKRRPVALCTGEAFFVGPDNGIFSRITKGTAPIECAQIANDALFLRPVSPTFHGRDIFAPVAAHLSIGVPFDALGPPVRDLVSLDLGSVEEIGDALIGRVVRVDRFGNLITNIDQATLLRFLGPRQGVVTLAGLTLNGIQRTYSDVPEGKPLALIDSSAFLAIAVSTGRASDRIGKSSGQIIGCRVMVKPAVN